MKYIHIRTYASNQSYEYRENIVQVSTSCTNRLHTHTCTLYKYLQLHKYIQLIVIQSAKPLEVASPQIDDTKRLNYKIENYIAKAQSNPLAFNLQLITCSRLSWEEFILILKAFFPLATLWRSHQGCLWLLEIERGFAGIGIKLDSYCGF